MIGISTYFHALEGRLRIKVPEIKRSPARAQELESSLQVFPGIKKGIANPTTGSLLIYFDVDVTNPNRILNSLQDLGYLKSVDLPNAKGPDITNRLAKGVALGLTEFACQRLLVALIL